MTQWFLFRLYLHCLSTESTAPPDPDRCFRSWCLSWREQVFFTVYSSTSRCYNPLMSATLATRSAYRNRFRRDDQSTRTDRLTSIDHALTPNLPVQFFISPVCHINVSVCNRQHVVAGAWFLSRLIIDTLWCCWWCCFFAANLFTVSFLHSQLDYI